MQAKTKINGRGFTSLEFDELVQGLDSLVNLLDDLDKPKQQPKPWQELEFKRPGQKWGRTNNRIK